MTNSFLTGKQAEIFRIQLFIHTGFITDKIKITDTEIMKLTVSYYMDDFVKNGGFDDLILGCTHYPLVAKHICSLYPNLRMYSSSAEVVREAAEVLKEKDMLAFADTDFKIHLLKLEE